MDELTKIVSDCDDKRLIIKATARWCGPCKKIQPFYDRLSVILEATHPVVFSVFDIDDVPELSDHLAVRTLPTFVCISETDSCTLASSDPEQLQAWIKQCLETKQHFINNQEKKSRRKK